MLNFNLADIMKMSKIFRLNLINSLTGYKSANLIATKTDEKINNVAVFSSVTHLGSKPPLIGFVTRPTTVPRNTYENILNHKYFTLNQITEIQIKSAHKTSAKFPKKISEFDKTDLDYEFKNNFQAPFVKNSPIQVGCKFLNEYVIKENGTILIVGEIKLVLIKDELLLEDGMIQLDKGNIVSVNGLDGYALPKLIKRFSYARPD